jgi:hypothetical protein
VAEAVRKNAELKRAHLHLERCELPRCKTLSARLQLELKEARKLLVGFMTSNVIRDDLRGQVALLHDDLEEVRGMNQWVLCNFEFFSRRKPPKWMI